MIDVESLTKIFPQGGREITALDGLSLQIQSGESMAILGQSGSGKSTLLSLLAGLDTPTSGHIQVAGFSYDGQSMSQLTTFRRDHIGIIFQQFHLMPHLNVFENIHLTLEIRGKTDPELCHSLIEQVGLSDRMTHLPHQLSGGECQRVAIARALIGRPRLLLADEPTGNLDGETAQKVADLLMEMVQQTETTLIMVTHNLELAERCRIRKRLVKGRLVSEN